MSRETDLLLSSEKQSKFERVIKRELKEEFGVESRVTVQTNGRVYLRAPSSDSDSLRLTRDADMYYEVLNVLSDITLEMGKSSYNITDGGEEIVGASFYLKRDGW